VTVAAGKENGDGFEILRSAEEAPEEAGAELVLVELLMRESLWDAHSMQPNVISGCFRFKQTDRTANDFMNLRRKATEISTRFCALGGTMK